MDDCGGAFAMGAIGGGLFSFIKGWRNSPPVSVFILCYLPVCIIQGRFLRVIFMLCICLAVWFKTGVDTWSKIWGGGKPIVILG